MSFRLTVFVVVSSMLMLSPIQGEENQNRTASTEASASGVLEERIRAYRESFDRQRALTHERHEEAEVRHESMRPPPPPQVVAQEKQLSARQQAMKKFHEEQQADLRKQQQEREALAAKWREARQKYQEVRVETYLRAREKKLANFEKRQEQMRNQAEDQYNYLVENQDEIMRHMLDQKIEIANRHEELRKQAGERRKKIVAARALMADMTPREKMVYMQAHRQALFSAHERVPRHMPRGAARPPMPPWAQQGPPPVVPRAPQP
jgi:hypothetical protein